MPESINIKGVVDLDFAKAQAQFNKFQSSVGASLQRGGFKGATQGVNEFEQAIGKATNRVVSLGAAAVVFNSISRAFSNFAKATIDVEQGLARINVNLGQSAEGLKTFSAQLFNIARSTGSTFENVAKAAEELARQGLGAEETIKRLNASLLLSRIAGIDAVEAANSLTTAINSFSKEGLTAIDIVNRFAAADTNFAVSSDDLADSVARVGSVAADAGVTFNKFLAIVTSVKQTTGLSGANIANGLKTIFTRVGNSSTLDQLQELGVAIKDTAGNALSADRVLVNLAKVYETLGTTQKNAVARLVGGGFQINKLTALLKDLAKEGGTYAQVQDRIADSTDTAVKKNEELSKTLSSLISSTKTSITQLFASLGGQSIAPFTKALLGAFEQARAFFSGDSGSDLGKDLGEGLLKGIANVISGPGLAAVGIILAKGLGKVVATIGSEAKSLLSVNNAGQARAEIQTRINALLRQATEAEYANFAAASSVLKQKEAILAIQLRLRQTELVGSPLQNAFLGTNILGGYKAAGPGKIPRFFKAGHVGNFADPLYDAIKREKKAGVPEHQIYIDRDRRLVSAGNPLGLGVANKRDEPNGIYQGVDRVIGEGADPKQAGIVGNFAKRPLRTQAELVNDRLGIGDSRFDDGAAKIEKAAKAVSSFEAAIIRSTQTEQRAQQEASQFGKSMTDARAAVTKFIASTPKPLDIKRGNGFAGDSLPPPNEGASTSPQGARLSQISADTQGFNARARAARGGSANTPSSFSSFIGPDIIKEERGKAVRADDVRSKFRDLIKTQEARKQEAIAINEEIAVFLSQQKADKVTARKARHDNALSSTRAAEDERSTFIGNSKSERRQFGLSRAVDQFTSGGNVRSAQLDLIKQELQAQAKQKASTFFAPGTDQKAINSFVKQTADANFAALQQKRSLSPNGKTTLSAADAARRAQRQNNLSLGLAFVAPLAAGFVGEGKGGTAGGVGRGAVSGALNGAGIGGIFGPLGAGLGAALGALGGAVSKSRKSIEEFNEEIDNATAIQTRNVDAVSRFVTLASQLDDSSLTNTARSSLQQQQAATLVELDPESRAALAKGNLTPAQLTDIQIKAQEKAARSSALGEARKTGNTFGQSNILDKTGDFFDNFFGKATGGVLRYATGVGEGQDAVKSFKGGGNPFNAFDGANESRAFGKDLSNLFIKNGGIGGVDQKFLNQSLIKGSGSAADIDKLSKTFEDLGVDTKVTSDNFITLVEALKSGISGFRTFKKVLDERGKDNGLVGLSKDAFRSSNTSVFATAGAISRNPLAGRGARSQATLNSFDELNKNQANSAFTDPTTAIGKEYRKALVGTQSANLSENALSFLQTSGTNVNGLRQRNGDISQTGLARLLKLKQGSGARSADRALAGEFLRDLELNANDQKNAGVSPSFQQTEGFTGTQEGSYSSSSSANRFYLNKNNLRFLRPSTIGKGYLTPSSFQSPTSGSSAPADYNNHQKQVNDDIQAALAGVAETNKAAIAAADALSKATLNILVKVDGADDSTIEEKAQAFFSDIFSALSGRVSKLEGNPQPPTSFTGPGRRPYVAPAATP